MVEVESTFDPVNKESFDCPICMDEVAPGSGYIFQSCKHSYCGSVWSKKDILFIFLKCLSGYFSENIMNGNAHIMKCPDPACENKISLADVRFIVDDDMFSKYEGTYLLNNN